MDEIRENVTDPSGYLKVAHLDPFINAR
ncbi:MAG: hypothetical protein ACI97A_001104, partial [Planctomycetota bacterium]